MTPSIKGHPKEQDRCKWGADPASTSLPTPRAQFWTQADNEKAGNCVEKQEADWQKMKFLRLSYLSRATADRASGMAVLVNP